jgi:hypothetical protein
MKRQTRAAQEALIRKKAGDFQKAFNSLLAAVPWELKLGYEAYFNAVFLLAMDMAGQAWDRPGSVGNGLFDVHLSARDGNDYIIEMKHVRRKEKGWTLAPEEIRLKNKMHYRRPCPRQRKINTA